MKNIITLVLLLTLFTSCKQDNPPICPPGVINPDLDSKIVWRIPLKHDTSFCYVDYPLVIENDVLIELHKCYSPTPMLRVHGEDGSVIWNEDYNNGNILSKTDEYFVTSDWHDVTVGNINTGEIIYSTHFENGNLDGNCVFSNAYFSTTSPQSGEDWDTAFIMYSPLDHEDWKVLIAKEKIDNFRPSFLPPVGWLNPNGDEILIFPMIRLDFPTNYQYEIYAYNLSADSLMWIAEDVEAYDKEVNTKNLPIIFNDKIYVQKSQSLICLDANTGEELWQRYFEGESFFRTKNLLQDNIFVLNSESSKMFGVDAINGELLWTKDDGGYAFEEMDYYNGKVYYSDGSQIKGIDILTGQTKWEYDIIKDGQFSNANFTSTIIINQDLKLLYTTDHLYFLAISLEE